eukprot:1946709-Rhodomonas_salina.1
MLHVSRNPSCLVHSDSGQSNVHSSRGQVGPLTTRVGAGQTRWRWPNALALAKRVNADQATRRGRAGTLRRWRGREARGRRRLSRTLPPNASTKSRSSFCLLASLVRNDLVGRVEGLRETAESGRQRASLSFTVLASLSVAFRVNRESVCGLSLPAGGAVQVGRASGRGDRLGPRRGARGDAEGRGAGRRGGRAAEGARGREGGSATRSVVSYARCRGR